MDMEYLKQWLGRTESVSDTVARSPLTGLAATLDYSEPPWPTNTIAPLGHWLYLLPQTRQSQIDDDGHAKRGGFLPPVPLPRRMWAGSRITFFAPIQIGTLLCRDSMVTGIEYKSGKSGELVFVNVTHVWSSEQKQLLVEHQDIVYRDMPKVATEVVKVSSPVLPTAEWVRQISPDPVLLFRYSALTFNGHRIHYDRAYCANVEAYPGLVVHGPLTATLLVDLFVRHHPDAHIASFSFRGRQPAFDNGIMTLCGCSRDGGADLWALNDNGAVVMTAELELT